MSQIHSLPWDMGGCLAGVLLLRASAWICKAGANDSWALVRLLFLPCAMGGDGVFSTLRLSLTKCFWDTK